MSMKDWIKALFNLSKQVRSQQPVMPDSIVLRVDMPTYMQMANQIAGEDLIGGRPIEITSKSFELFGVHVYSVPSDNKTWEMTVIRGKYDRD